MCIMKLSGKVFLLLFLVFAIGKAEIKRNASRTEQHEWTDKSSGSKNEQSKIPLIKLAIFYDDGFKTQFDNSPSKIQEYFEATLFDAHSEFPNFSGIRLSLQATSLIFFKEPENQSLFNRVRTNADEHDAANELIDNFQSFAYNQLSVIPSFDVAVLAMGHTNTDFAGLQFDKLVKGSICNPKNEIERKWISSLVIPLQKSPAFLLRLYISRMLGGLREDNTLCLEGNTALEKPIIDSTKLFENPSTIHAYTLVEQCQMLLNDRTTPMVVEYESSDCKEVTCINQLNNDKLLTFQALEGSICDEDGKGRCFQGLCVQHKIHLVNVGTGKCLVSEKSLYGTNDKPILQECSKVVTQTFVGVGIRNCHDREELVIAFPYLRNYVHLIKVLTLGMDGTTKMTFCSYPGECRDTLVEIHRLSKNDQQEFLLELDQLRLYLKASNDGVNVELTTDGSGNDDLSRWKLVVLDEELVMNQNCQKSKTEQLSESLPTFEVKQRIEL